MNSHKKILSAITLAALAAPVLAQSANPQQAFIDAMKAAYRGQANASGATAAAGQINSGAQSDPDCAATNQARVNAARIYVQNKLPPDPTTVIQNSSCFLDVMDIRIPTTGYGALDFLIGQMDNYLQSTACNKSTNFWNQTVQNIQSGNVGGLLGQTFNLPNGATQVNYGSNVGTGNSTGTPGYVPSSAYTQAQQNVISTSVGFITDAMSVRYQDSITNLQTQIATLQQQLGLYQGGWLYGDNGGGN